MTMRQDSAVLLYAEVAMVRKGRLRVLSLVMARRVITVTSSFNG
ncbi:hypothetical protein UTI89UKE3_022 [Escherichia phage vB_EcoP-UTI89UKE3]|uniref:Uncharacterized protein n=1 Tax=Escherichia phage vB_EcoP-UTI89UKE2 TaxID=2865826 RepID=A0AAE8C5L8_9CAUD|nr:hypothetical protein UTI89UKE2_022 [Escherichia phage vB_EcoP-UTI89UKE2]QZI84623.1 hypothetical protein UTI89UKE3_022 [Escherichia phage vB_EcoP-UTI89UKE3]